ncbi:MAG: hypothetical protein R3F20_02730 [Planctomycetota bacterium]
MQLQEIEERSEARLQLLEITGTAVYAPAIDPATFSADVDHPCFPLPIGRRLVYEKSGAEGSERVVRVVRGETRIIAGVPCRGVTETVFEDEDDDGEDDDVVEDTTEWFSVDARGNVWMFGEDVRIYEEGHLVSIEGSWRHGRRGALAGIAVLAAPMDGVVHRQQLAPNAAENVVEVLSSADLVVVGRRVYAGCLTTLDSTPLEPGHVECKSFAPGVGVVREVDLQTGETLDLVSITDLGE